MKTIFLDFEQPIAELEGKIEQLRFVQDDSAVDISEEISRLEAKSLSLTKDIYAKLTPWQIAKSELLDLAFELGNRLFEIQEGRFHSVNCTPQSANAPTEVISGAFGV